MGGRPLKGGTEAARFLRGWSALALTAGLGGGINRPWRRERHTLTGRDSPAAI